MEMHVQLITQLNLFLAPDLSEVVRFVLLKNCSMDCQYMQTTCGRFFITSKLELATGAYYYSIASK